MKKTLLLLLGLLTALPAHAQNSQHPVNPFATPASCRTRHRRLLISL
jgi:hypothetical protein